MHRTTPPKAAAPLLVSLLLLAQATTLGTSSATPEAAAQAPMDERTARDLATPKPAEEGSSAERPAQVLPEGNTAPTLTLTITEADAQPENPWGLFDAYPVKFYDFNGDGRKEIIDHNDNKFVYVFDSATGAILAELTTTFPDFWGARTINGVEARRLNLTSTVPSLIVGNSAAYVTRFDYDAAESNATHFDFDKVWERRLDDYASNPGMDAKPVLVDINKDGPVEIFAQVEEVGLYALRSNGSVLWKVGAGGGNAEPVLADVDLDGHMEAVFFSDAGIVRVYNAKTGAFEWSYDAKQDIGSPGSIPRGGWIANLDGSGRREIVFCARDAHDPGNVTANHMGLFVVGNDDMVHPGNLKWFRQPEWAAPLCYTRPVIWDFNGDGKMEIYGMDWNTMGHNPGNWEVSGPAHAFSFESNGTERWHTTMETWWSNKDIAIADLDGDGEKEILANGPDAGHDGWWMLSAANGTQEQFVDVYPYKTARAPRLTDIDGDGDLDFVAPVEGHQGNTTPGEGALQVWDAGTPASSVFWSGGEDWDQNLWPFKANFAPQPESNESYVKVKVTSYHNVVKAWFNEDGGAWQKLDKVGSGTTWTMWGKAASVPAGTMVKFLAEDDLGKRVTSGNYTWPP